MAKKANPQYEVSVIVPCLNEEKTIQLLLDAILKQNYPIEKIEVIISDAISTDKTRERILDFEISNPTLAIRIVDNIKRTIPAALNLAADSAKGEFLIRLDAHSIPNKDYIPNSIKILQSEKAQNVGGIWEIYPGDGSCMARSIARAVSHPLGAGDAAYRLASEACFVDTVPFGAFRKKLFIQTRRF